MRITRKKRGKRHNKNNKITRNWFSAAWLCLTQKLLKQQKVIYLQYKFIFN